VGQLSQHLNGRPDHGSDPTALSRGDVEAFLNRVAYLEADGQISRYRRNMICRDVRAVLAGIRGLGLARAGQVAAGLAGDVAIGRADIPADPAARGTRPRPAAGDHDSPVRQPAHPRAR